jgi:hypothetical protein
MNPHGMFLVGLDLGQSQDYTAICVTERIQPRVDWLWDGLVPTPPAVYHCRHLERLPLGTSYPDIAAHIRAMLLRPPLCERETYMAIDATGVGRPVVDWFRRARLRVSLYGVTIHGGDTTTKETAMDWHVPKRDLIAATQVLLQAQRLKFASALPETATLVKELLDYRVKIDPATAHDSYNAREGVHDDLVLALALSVFIGEKLVYTGEGIRFMFR